MLLNYLCKRCSYSTSHLNDIKRHIIKKKKCVLKNDVFLKYSNDQILVFSLIPYENNIQNIDENEIEHLKSSDKITKNINELLEYLDQIYKEKLKVCKFCNKDFCKINDLRKHVIISCFHNELERRENEIKLSSLNINSCNNINNTNNHCTFNNIKNQNNNVNIFLNIKPPVPFDENWNLSEINRLTKIGLIFSNFMYSELLEQILQNEINLNVIVDKNNNLGMIYKNDVDKYIEMKSKDIVSNTMKKLHENLLEITNSDLNTYMNFNKKDNQSSIDKKYKDYLNSAFLNDRVNEVILNILDSKKYDAKNIAEKIINQHADNVNVNVDNIDKY